MILFWILGAIILLFGWVVFRGAPYVPTHRKQVEHALDMLSDLPKGSTLVDLGSGDGVFLKAAAERGYKVVGYELNPLLCLVSYIRCWRYRSLVQIRLRDFWLTPLPNETRAVFVFLAGPYLRQLNAKLTHESANKALIVISYGFEIPGKKDRSHTSQALHLYYYGHE